VTIPAASIISAVATASSQTRLSSSASRATVMGLSVSVSRSSSGVGSMSASCPVAEPCHCTNRPSGSASQTPFGAPSSAPPAIIAGWSSVTYPAAA
jgi:hypothetical protein